MGYIVGIGAANIDIFGKSKARVVMRDSNPGHMVFSVGGVTRNILENLSRQGMNVQLIAAVGDDPFGDQIIKTCQTAGIGVSHVLRVPNRSSSTYTALIEDTGDMLVAVSDMHITECLTPEYMDSCREWICSSDAIITDPCMPYAFLEYLIKSLASGKKIFVDPVSTTYARKLKPLVGSIYALKPNLLELEVLSDLPVGMDASDEQIMAASSKVLDMGVHRLAVSLGARGCYYADRDGRKIFRSLGEAKNVINATGAGDAFMAGFTHGCVQGWEPEEILDYSMASGIVALTSELTIHPEMSDELVRKTIKQYRTERGGN